MRLSKILLSIIFLLSTAIGSFAIEPMITIDQILVNSSAINPNSQIIISTSDTIEFQFHVELEESDKPNILFKYNFTASAGVQSASTRFGSIKYSSLPEDNYELMIYAFSREFTTDSLFFKITVNNTQAQLLKELAMLKFELAEKDSLLKNSQGSEMIANANGVDIIALMAGAIAGGIVAFLVLFPISRKKVKVFEQLYQNEIEEKSKLIDRSRYDQLHNENSRLRSEVSTLRGQIDALHSRADELRKQNVELQESFDKAQLSKTELEELQKQKDELFAVIIHDIKNPVALIKSLVELLRSYDLTAIEQSEVIDDIFNTTKTIVSLSQEVSRILTLETSELVLNFEKIQLNDLLAEAYQRYTYSAQSKRININFDPRPDLPMAEVDSNRIEEVIDNLVSNAIKFSQQGTSIRMSAHKIDSSVVVEVSDNGLGMSEEDIKQAFQRGAKLSAKPTGNETSSGLGLWIVKKLIEAHKGRVWVKSILGKGSTFAFSVPTRQDSNN